MSFPSSRFKKNILATTIGLVLVSASTDLLATVITANVDYSLNGGATVNDNETSSTTPSSVDLLANASAAGADVFYHTYGSTSGNFGSRVDGSGTFDITGSFLFEDSYTNSSAVSQDVNLDFTIVAGQVANTFNSLDPLQSLFSMYNIDVMVDFDQDGTFDSTLFHSSVTVSSDDSGSIISKTGTLLTGYNENNSPGFAQASWQQHFESLLVGSIAAGDSFDLQYLLTTTASGAGLSNNDCGEGDGDRDLARVTDGDGFGCNNAISRIGDPLNFGNNNTNAFSISSQPTNAVPEPAGLALLGLGFSTMLVMRRKKLKITQ